MKKFWLITAIICTITALSAFNGGEAVGGVMLLFVGVAALVIRHCCPTLPIDDDLGLM